MPKRLGTTTTEDKGRGREGDPMGAVAVAQERGGVEELKGWTLDRSEGRANRTPQQTGCGGRSEITPRFGLSNHREERPFMEMGMKRQGKRRETDLWEGEEPSIWFGTC